MISPLLLSGARWHPNSGLACPFGRSRDAKRSGLLEGD